MLGGKGESAARGGIIQKPGERPHMDKLAELASWPPKFVIYSTDFSSSSEHAGHYARLLAQTLRAELVVAHAFNLSEFAAEVEAETGPGAKSVQRKDLETALATSTQRFGEGLDRVSSILVEGDPVERIPQLAKEREPSIIVLGTRGRGRLGRSLIGSTADRILRSADGPCLTVGPQVPEMTSETAPVRHVLFATDLTPASARGAAYAMGMAEELGAGLDALHVVRESDMNHPERLDLIRREFHGALEAVVPGRAGSLAEPKEWIESGSAHTRILEHVREHKVDLLVLSVRRSSHLWLRERLSGAFYIIAHATCPVMTITG
jgi:nucleotide-binding universal stress UspA family protein